MGRGDIALVMLYETRYSAPPEDATVSWTGPWSQFESGFLEFLLRAERSVEGACKHLVQSRFKRAGMRWKTPGFLSVVELRVARLNGTDGEFWASRGLVGKVAA